jgi:hypothetical protein
MLNGYCFLGKGWQILFSLVVVLLKWVYALLSWRVCAWYVTFFPGRALQAKPFGKLAGLLPWGLCSGILVTRPMGVTRTHSLGLRRLVIGSSLYSNSSPFPWTTSVGQWKLRMRSWASIPKCLLTHLKFATNYPIRRWVWDLQYLHPAPRKKKEKLYIFPHFS